MLKVMWFVPPAIHAVADSGGLLAAYGLHVEGIPTGSSDQQYEALLAGECDVAVTAMDNVILWNRRGRGDDFRIVAQVERTTSIALVARPEFTTVASLDGGRLLVDSVENGFVIALRMMLDDAGIAFDACTVLPAGGVKERFAALIAGDGDATLLGPPFLGMAEAAGMQCLAHADRAFPGFPGQGIVVRTGQLGDRRDEIVRWLAALEQARADIVADPLALMPRGATLPVATALVDAVSTTLVPDPAGIDLLVAQRRHLGLPGADAVYSTLVDTGLLTGALAAGG